MVAKLIRWAIDNVVAVIIAVTALIAVGTVSFLDVNVEAYPDPAPAIIEVVAQYTGASAEEVERQVTIPIEVALAGMPGLKYTRAKSLFGLSHLRNQFEYGVDYQRARQEVTNRLMNLSLPDGVTPQITPASPIGEIFRYTLRSPKDALGRDIYSIQDLKSLEDWTLERELRRVPGVAGVSSSGGETKRFEIHPDPDRLAQYGITLEQVQKAVSESNANVGGDYVIQGPQVEVVRGIALIGGGEDPMKRAMGVKTPEAAAAILREGELRRIQEIRRIVIASTNNVPIRVEHIVDGGPVNSGEKLGVRGVIVGHPTRQGKLGYCVPDMDENGHDRLDPHGQRKWIEEDDSIQAIVLMRKGEQSIPTLKAVIAKVGDMNANAGYLLPGVKIDPFYNRGALVEVTTATVRENLAVGICLVSIILLMFLSNVRAAIIVAINIPLALLFAFAVLYLRGKSANLLSIGAVDFGIIVDSTVIMVENIFRHLRLQEDSGIPVKEKIVRACNEVQKALFFSTIIMIFAMVPLFTMQGPEGQIFGPMADTYAFSLAGALVLALTFSPLLCLLFLKNIEPKPENFFVRGLKSVVLRQLEWALRFRWVCIGAFAAVTVATVAYLPFLGREFMPELEEGNMWVRGTFPVNVSLEEAASKARIARHIMRKFPEVKLVTSLVGRPDDGFDPTGFYNLECFVPLESPEEWPIAPGHKRPRTKQELIDEMNTQLSSTLVGINWDFSQMIRDNVMEALSGVKGENSIKIFGPDLDVLEELGHKFQDTLAMVPGVFDPGMFRIKGQTDLLFPVDREKCALWNVSVANLEDVIQTAVGGKQVSEIIEGEKRFDLTLRWPPRLRRTQEQILNIPVDVVKNSVTAPVTTLNQTRLSGSATGISSTGTSVEMPSLTGNAFNATLDDISRVPRRRIRDLVTPMNRHGDQDPNGRFVREGASTIYREQGNRFVAVKFGVRGRDLASTVAEAKERTAKLLPATYRTIWSGEFQQMEEAEHRMVLLVSVSLALIVVTLYIAFKSLLDVAVVMANVLAMSLGGVWTLLITGVNFNISAAVGFISILGVAVMNGLLLVSAFNHLRTHGVPVHESIVRGLEKRIRPLTMTCLSAILGLLPAALSTRIGSQSQRPLAIVVVGGMITTMLLTSLIPVMYSFYGHREPPEGAGDFAE
jgi:cobalt-zinc-cadmium resistance protein CzcA